VIRASVHADPDVRNPELVRCFRHEGEDCSRRDGSGLDPASIVPGAASPPVGLAEGARP